MTIVADELRTNFSDGLANLVTIHTFNNGSITVVPEPGTLALLIGGGLAFLTYAWRRRRWR